MEKNQIIVWILSLFFVFPAVSYGSSIKIPTVGKSQYIDLSFLLENFPELEIREKPAILIAEIRGNGKSIRIRSGSSFYVLDSRIVKIPVKIVFSRGQFYLPPDVVEAILMHLVGYEVLYQYEKDFLVLEIQAGNLDREFLPIRAVVIDAGHGGKDPGTSDKDRNYEKDITLRIALGLESALKKKFPEMIVQLTRRQDVFIALEERSAAANRFAKDARDAVFLSIHCNASLSPIPSGYEIYFLSQTPTTESDREIAIRENGLVDGSYPPPIPSIQAGLLSNLIQRRSKSLAVHLDIELEKGIGRFIPSRGVKKANFSVLRGTLMPAVLIELGYLSHPKEAVYLNSPKIQDRFIESIVRGVAAYAKRKD